MGFVYESDIIKKYGLDRKDCFEFTSECVDAEPITVWRTLEDGHNHWDSGHLPGISPIPNCEYQKKKWKDRVWGKSFRWILWYKVKFNPVFPGQPVGKIV